MRYTLALTALLAVGTIFDTCAAAQSSLVPERVEKVINQRIAQGKYPAVVIAVVDGDRSDVYGFGKLDDGTAPNADTVFEIGSITKTFTATLLAKAVLDGELKLDAPVASLLPGFEIPSRNGKFITLESLANQHSGLPRMPSNFAPAKENDPYADYDGDKLKTFLAGYQLAHDPGSTYGYSNVGVGLLGYALAQHSGTSYNALLHEHIFDPLGMHASDVRISDAMQAHLALGHDENGNRVANWNLDALAGAGAIKSDGADMLRYLKANMGLQISPLGPAMQLAQEPRVSAPAGSPEDRIGLVWMTHYSVDGGVIWHNGATGGYHSFIGFTADRRHGVVVLNNSTESVDDVGFAVLEPGAPLTTDTAAVQQTITLDEAALASYVGRYQLAAGLIFDITLKDGQLRVQLTGQRAVPIYATARDRFFVKLVDAQIDFERDASDNVIALTLHQNGANQRAQRMVDDVGLATPPPGAAQTTDHAVAQQVINLDAAALAAYVGRYQLAPGAIIDVTLKEGQMRVQLTGQPAFPIYASAPDKFFLKVVDAQIDFERDAHGKVVALILHQNGANQRAQQINE
jgi:CubicO group peptidase (beta-lactamase class C family)